MIKNQLTEDYFSCQNVFLKQAVNMDVLQLPDVVLAIAQVVKSLLMTFKTL